MKKLILSLLAGVPLIITGCGSAENLTGTEEQNDGEIMAVALTGAGSTDEAMAEAEADINAQMMGKVSQKVEEYLNDEMQTEEFQLAFEQAQSELAASPSKDVSVGISLKGLVVKMTDEVIPFANGSMLLNGDLSVKLKIRAGGKLALETSGELQAELQGVERSGLINGIPYFLSLDGSNILGIDGALTVTIKSWKIASMSADFTAAIEESNVTATGTIDNKSVVGKVDLSDVSIALSNPDVLHAPKNFSAACSGIISTTVNDKLVAGCTMEPSCKACK